MGMFLSGMVRWEELPSATAEKLNPENDGKKEKRMDKRVVSPDLSRGSSAAPPQGPFSL